MNIGQRIRGLRRERDLTLDDLSKSTGLALATLSRIENNKLTGTLKTHTKICKAFNITLAILYSGLDSEAGSVDMQTKSLRTEVFMHNKKSSSEMLTSKVLGKRMMPVIIKIEPSGSTDTEQNTQDTEKFIYVLSGEIQAVVGTEKLTVKSGNTLYFNASLPHHLVNTTKNAASCICVISPPAL